MGGVEVVYVGCSKEKGIGGSGVYLSSGCVLIEKGGKVVG